MMISRACKESALVVVLLWIAAWQRCGAQDEFVRGDANGDARVNLADAHGIVGFLFDALPIPCYDAADANDDGRMTVEDAFYLALMLVHGATPCLPPCPVAGVDPTDDPLTCVTASLPAVAPPNMTFDLRLDDVNLPASQDSVSIDLFMDATSLSGVDTPQSFSAAIRYPSAKLEVMGVESLVESITEIEWDAGGADGTLTLVGYPTFAPMPPFPRIPQGPIARLSFAVRQAQPNATLPLSFTSYGGTNPRYVYTGVGLDGIFMPCDGSDGSIVIGEGATRFRRGDANADGEINVADAVSILAHLFGRDKRLPCVKSADANDDNSVNIADAVFVLGYLFAHGANPPAPFDGCGIDPTSDDIPCASFEPCGG